MTEDERARVREALLLARSRIERTGQTGLFTITDEGRCAINDALSALPPARDWADRAAEEWYSTHLALADPKEHARRLAEIIRRHGHDAMESMIRLCASCGEEVGDDHAPEGEGDACQHWFATGDNAVEARCMACGEVVQLWRKQPASPPGEDVWRFGEQPPAQNDSTTQNDPPPAPEGGEEAECPHDWIGRTALTATGPKPIGRQVCAICNEVREYAESAVHEVNPEDRPANLIGVDTSDLDPPPPEAGEGFEGWIKEQLGEVPSPDDMIGVADAKAAWKEAEIRTEARVRGEIVEKIRRLPQYPGSEMIGFQEALAAARGE